MLNGKFPPVSTHSIFGQYLPCAGCAARPMGSKVGEIPESAFKEFQVEPWKWSQSVRHKVLGDAGGSVLSSAGEVGEGLSDSGPSELSLERKVGFQLG